MHRIGGISQLKGAPETFAAQPATPDVRDGVNGPGGTPELGPLIPAPEERTSSDRSGLTAWCHETIQRRKKVVEAFEETSQVLA